MELLQRRSSRDSQTIHSENNIGNNIVIHTRGCIRWKWPNFCKSEKAFVNRRIVYKRIDLPSSITLNYFAK
jgi:hypothetical protein